MKKSISFIVILFICYTQIIAQINAITDSGDEVYLFDDGTWRYVDNKLELDNKIAVNETVFLKSENQSFMVKSSKANLGIWIDPKKWSFNKQSNNPDVEYEFSLRDEDLYGMLISEKIQIPINSLKKIAYDNAVAAAPDVTIVKEEYRKVNGLELLMLRMEGTIDGIKFAYQGYYYSNESGTIQMVLYTGSNLMDYYSDEVFAFLNGLSEYEVTD